MKFGGRRSVKHASGSLKNGIQKPMRSPRVAVSWPADLLDKLNVEAIAKGLPFAEIVRRRVKASYQAEVR